MAAHLPLQKLMPLGFVVVAGQGEISIGEEYITILVQVDVWGGVNILSEDSYFVCLCLSLSLSVCLCLSLCLSLFLSLG